MNAFAKNIFSQGSQRICLYAIRDIEKGEEIRFDYDGNKIMVKRFPWIDDRDEEEKRAAEYKSKTKKSKIKKTASKCHLERKKDLTLQQNKLFVSKKRMRIGEIEAETETSENNRKEENIIDKLI